MKYTRTWAALMLLAALGAGLGLAGCSEPEAADFDSVAREMEAYVSEGKVAGVVTMVVRNGETVHAHATGFRDVASGDSLEVDDLFRVASQTKAVTSVAIMMLAEEGKLTLDDPLHRYIPEFERARVAVETEGGYRLDTLNARITLRHLLTHTAGMSYGLGVAEAEYEAAGILGWYLAYQERPIQDVVRKLAGLPLAAQPSERWVYGYATDVLGAVVEIVSGESLDRFFRDRIFEPLQMRDTHFFVPEEKASRLTTVYGNLNGTLVRMPDGAVMESQGQYVDGPRACFSGGAGLVSTAPDYIRLQRMLLNRGELEGVRILSPESVDQMTMDHAGEVYDGDELGFGLGFRLYRPEWEGPEPPGTYSWGGAYHSHYWIDPSNNLVAIILTQLIPAGDIDIHKRFTALVYEVLEH